MTKRLTLFSIGLLTLVACSPKLEESEKLVEVIKIDGLRELLTTESDDIQVINFWATWCAPCIKELPYFEELNAERGDELDVTLISLDFVDEVEQKVIPFVEKRELKSRIVLLDEIDYNSWIDTVDPSWSGAIPATLIVNSTTGQRKFLEKELEEGELEEILKEFIN